MHTIFELFIKQKIEFKFVLSSIGQTLALQQAPHTIDSIIYLSFFIQSWILNLHLHLMLLFQEADLIWLGKIVG